MSFLSESLYAGFVISLLAYLAGMHLKKKFKLTILNPLLVSVIFVILVLAVFRIDYGTYQYSAKYISYLLTPATVCLAIPLYKQLNLLKQNIVAVMTAIAAGVLTSAATIYVMCRLFGLGHQHYVSLLPKSITTAIAIGVSEEAGGLVTMTVVCITITGIFGNMIGETVFKLLRINRPIAKGLALGTSAHAIGTARALEIDEVAGAMGSLSIAVAGLLTVIAVPLAARLI